MRCNTEYILGKFPIETRYLLTAITKEKFFSVKDGAGNNHAILLGDDCSWSFIGELDVPEFLSEPVYFEHYVDKPQEFGGYFTGFYLVSVKNFKVILIAGFSKGTVLGKHPVFNYHADALPNGYPLTACTL